MKDAIKQLEGEFLDFKKNGDEVKNVKEDLRYQTNLIINRI